MCKCIKTGEELPPRNVNFIGYECREKERYTCPQYSHVFCDGTNCRLLRKPINVRAILGIEKREA